MIPPNRLRGQTVLLQNLKNIIDDFVLGFREQVRLRERGSLQGNSAIINVIEV